MVEIQWGPGREEPGAAQEQRNGRDLAGGGHIQHREVSQAFPKQRLGLLFWGEMGNRKKHSGFPGLPGGSVGKGRCRPKTRPCREPTLGFVGVLWSRKQTEGVCCHFPGTCALEVLPRPSKAPWASESCQERVLGLPLLAHFPPQYAKTSVVLQQRLGV